MKFACDKCNTRYSIADERVHGRVLKIRCKACNNVITVREDAPVAAGESMQDALNQFAGSDDEHTRVSMAPPPGVKEPGEAPSDDWFVSFDGEQEGPLPLSRALDRVKSERPRGRECFCWRAGFFVWLPVEDVAEFAPALAKAAPPPIPTRPARATGQQAAVKSPTGQQAAVKSPTGQQAAVKSPTGQQAAVKSPTGQQAAVKSPTGAQPALRSTGAAAAPKSPTGQQPTAKSPAGRSTGSHATAQPAPSSRPLEELPPLDSGPLSTPASLMPSLVTRPEPRMTRKSDEPLAAAVPLPAADSGPAVSPFLAALQASGPTQVANGAPGHEPAPRAESSNLDSGPVPLPPPPGDELPIGEASGLLNLSHLSKPALATPKATAPKRGIETFGGVPVIPTPAAQPQPVVVSRGAARGGAPWMKWAALGGALATVSLLVVVVVLMARKPTVIVVPPAPTLDDGKKMNDKPITIADPGPTPSPGQPAGDPKRAQKRPLSSARAASSVKPPADKDSLSSAQRNLASLYRDENEHGVPQSSPGLDRGGRGAGGQVSQQAIMGVVTQNRRSLNLCYDRVLKHDSSLKSGRVVTHVKVGISGSVTGVSVPDPQYANSEIGQCIAQTIKHWHFPSADAEYETEFPIILQAN